MISFIYSNKWIFPALRASELCALRTRLFRLSQHLKHPPRPPQLRSSPLHKSLTNLSLQLILFQQYNCRWHCDRLTDLVYKENTHFKPFLSNLFLSNSSSSHPSHSKPSLPLVTGHIDYYCFSVPERQSRQAYSRVNVNIWCLSSHQLCNTLKSRLKGLFS